jgi:hypothetical protein
LHDLIEEKRGRRRRLTKAVIRRQTQIAKNLGLPIDEPNRFAKHHATNCSRPNCVNCGNPRKVWGERTLQEKKFIQGIDDE